MVVALGPGKFYGSSLPRPRIYTDVKLSDDGIRVDPPVSVMDPFLTWANDAHWSMGGLCFKRQRLQGRIEGSIKKLRVQQERTFKAKKKMQDDMEKKPNSTSPPLRRAILLKEESEDEEERVVMTTTPTVRRSSARRLGDDFDKSVSVVSSVTERKGKSKGVNDSPISVETSNANPLKKKKKKKSNEPITTKSVPDSFPLPQLRRALLLNDDDSEEVEEEPESNRRRNRRSRANEKTNNTSSPLSATRDGVAFRTRGQKLEENNAPPSGLCKLTKRWK